MFIFFKYYLLNFLTFGLYKQFLLNQAPMHFQIPGTLTFDRMIDFHDFIMIYLAFIFVLFAWCLFWSVNIFRSFRFILIPLVIWFVIEICIFYTISLLHLGKGRKYLSSPQNFFLFLRKILWGWWFFIYVYFGRSLLMKSICDFPQNLTEIKNYISFYIYCVIYPHFFFIARRATHAPKLEMFWTIAPSFILIAIAIPSLYLLYMLDAVAPLSLAVKVIGHQWYWSYEIGCSGPLFKSISTQSITSFDSYMLSNSTLRLLEVDNVLFVPAGIPLTFFITSVDVIHSWAVPSLGVKVDAIPGRLNQVCITVFDVNIYRGQCSELCGINHGFMPINLVSVVDKLRYAWVF